MPESNSVKSFSEKKKLDSEKKKTDSETDFSVSGSMKSVLHTGLSRVQFSFSPFLLPVQFK